MWRTVKLGDVVSYEKVNGQGSNRPYVGMEHISSETMELVGSLEIPEKTSSTFKFDERHVLFGRLRPYLRKVFVPDFDGQCSTEIFCLLPSDKVDKKFLAHWLLHPKVSTRINETSTGAQMPRANMNAILDFDFPLPPLAEQQRIVAKLDAAFAEVDRAIAFENKKEVEVNILGKSVLENVFSTPYPVAKVSELGDVKSGGTPNSKEASYWNGNIPWYSSGELNNLFTSKSEKFITLAGLNKSNAKLFPKGTLLVGMYDTAAMKMSILHQEATFNQAIVGIEPNKLTSAEYLFYALNFLKPTILLERRGVRQQNLSLAKIKNIAVPLPNPATQQEIVERLTALNAEQASYQSVTAKKREQLRLLKSAILAQELQPSEAA